MRIGLLGAVILAACGGGGGSGDDVTVPDAMGGGVVADPGANAIPFSWPDTEPNEMPLIREGCAVRALTFLDQQIFAPGLNATDFAAGKNVA